MAAWPATGPADAAEGKFAADGPTIQLNYDTQTFRPNPAHWFLYFIPLISLVGVNCQTSAGNTQQVGVLSYERAANSRSFRVSCEFAVTGEGSSRYSFDPAGIMALRATEVKPGETLTNLLDYIDFTGAGFGSVEVRGTVAGATETVTQVEIRFNARGRESPVTVGLYDIPHRNGQYRLANRSNQVVARVNALSFKRSDHPRMGISVASITRKAQRAGFFGWLKAAVANLFIPPARVDKRGNDALLDFGYALLKQEPVFTFPRAGNLRQVASAAVNDEADGRRKPPHRPD
jgi:hypothetical protein